MKKNKGYTLIEVIIVLAIMAVLAGLSFVSLGVMHQAKYNAAANTINNEMSTLWMQTKTMSQPKEQTSKPGASAKEKYPICMQIKRNADKSYSIIYGYDSGTAFEEKVAGEVSSTIPKILNIEFIAKDPTKEHPTNTFVAEGSSSNVIDSMLIEFNKADGSVKYGAGTYNIIYSDRTVVSIYLDSVTGKHYIK